MVPICKAVCKGGVCNLDRRRGSPARVSCIALSTGLGPRDAAKKLSQNVARRVIVARCFLGHVDTQTHRHTDTQTHRHTDTQTHRHTDTQTHRHTDTQTRYMTSFVNRRTVSAEDFFFFFWSLPSALIDTRLPNCTARFHGPDLALSGAFSLDTTCARERTTDCRSARKVRVSHGATAGRVCKEGKFAKQIARFANLHFDVSS